MMAMAFGQSLALAMVALSQATIQLNDLYTDNMVMQTNYQGGFRPFWRGYADPFEVINISGLPSRTPGNSLFSAQADSGGAWVIQLDPHIPKSADESFTVTVTGNATASAIVIQNVKYGEVFFCSGQSNMEVPVSYAYNYTQAVADAAALLPQIRFFRMPVRPEDEPTYNIGGAVWQQANQTNILPFSAVCFFSLVEVMKQRSDPNNTPFPVNTTYAMIYSAQGSTCIESWMPSSALDQAYKTCTSKHPVGGIAGASQLYNGMIYPALKYSVGVFLWDQGECNSHYNTAEEYTCLFSTLISAWRDLWGQGDVPFVFVQIGAYVDQGNVSTIRLAQAATLPQEGSKHDVTGMAMSYDLGSPCPGSPKGTWCIHCRNKTEIGRRLGRQVLRTAYSWTNRSYTVAMGYVDAMPPTVADVTTSGNTVAIAMDYAEGLSLAPAQGCVACCSNLSQTFRGLVNDKWESLTATLDGRVLELDTDAGLPTVVQYAVQDVPQCVLYNNQGFASSPFALNVSAHKQSKRVPNTQPLRIGQDPNLKGPPMGVNTWNYYHCSVSENVIRSLTDAVVELGFAKAGYKFINVDGGWKSGRAGSNHISADPVRFPGDLKAAADYVHSKGLLFGTYTARNQYDCDLRPGAYSFEAVDAAYYCEQGVDYLKVDSCAGKDYPSGQAYLSWDKFNQAFGNCSRPIVMSVEYCRTPDPSGCAGYIADKANLWRVSKDLEATWASVMYNLEATNTMANVSKIGHYNDPDMLQVGNVGLSYNEAASHFAMWCFVNAPLLLGTDLVGLRDRPEYLSILLNTDLIALNQDSLGFQGRRLGPANSQGVELWYKKLADGGVAAALLNKGDADMQGTIDLTKLGFSSTTTVTVYDCWAHKSLANAQGSIQAPVCSHCTVVYRLKSEN
eukprot:TRINITY_DN12091_c0_g2_i3.p2 TRINITY_DN12091_c0_g2~~TRINITY_DN12091_c0_g2_i3.p2  ORF type:complete len:900 (+),score=153.83 TRINITY_DN12091_c0_g2_i3:3886-6585(+)